MIALMAALLFPVISKGRTNAATAYDLNNNKQILVAMQMYAGDNDDFLPQPGWGSDVACWASGAGMPPGGEPYTASHYNDVVDKQVASFHGGQLYSYLKNPSLLKCPSDDVIDAFYLRRRVYICSYVWNAAILGFPTKPPEGRFPKTFKLREFKPDAFLEWEADEMRPFCFDDFSNYPDEGISKRHGTTATIGRFDGGAQRLALDEFLADSGTVAPDFEHSGTGWRKSLIPAPNRLWCSPQNRGVPPATATIGGP